MGKTLLGMTKAFKGGFCEERRENVEHRHIRWGRAKQKLMDDFKSWIAECDHTRENTPKDMIEFLYQKGFIKGKKWRAYIDNIAEKDSRYCFIRYEPLCEGKIPPDTWV